EQDMKQLLQADPRLMMNFIHILSNIIAYLTKKVGMLSMSVKEKVVIYLKELQQQQQSNDITLPLSRQAIASMFAIQKFSLQRCLNELQEEGAIKIDGKHIQIISL
ncbi:MAG: winged helix-turn-helix domain-containing protein, partial [Prevotella sp.]|nr:winged helix-turn-helix domain-containing protein [Prevotella sp.]